jgi:hypothetical protein
MWYAAIRYHRPIDPQQYILSDRARSGLAAPQAVENFRHVGYPQQLRVLLGIAKLAGAIVLLLPRLPTLKEWAYAGFTFMWIAATVAHYLAGDGALVLLPPALIASLAVSYSHATAGSPRFGAGGAAGRGRSKPSARFRNTLSGFASGEERCRGLPRRA